MTAELQAKLAARISREYFLSEDAAKKQAQEAVQHGSARIYCRRIWSSGQPENR